MKKEEFRNIIDEIQPDVYMKNRLKAKVVGASAKPKRTHKAVVALCLAAAVALGTGFAAKRPAADPENPAQDTTQNIVLDMMSGFIVLASAAEAEKQTAIPLRINEGYDCGIKLTVTDIRGMTDGEKENVRSELDNGIYAYRNEEDFSRAEATPRLRMNFISRNIP